MSDDGKQEMAVALKDWGVGGGRGAFDYSYSEINSERLVVDGVCVAH